MIAHYFGLWALRLYQIYITDKANRKKFDEFSPTLPKLRGEGIRKMTKKKTSQVALIEPKRMLKRKTSMKKDTGLLYLDKDDEDEREEAREERRTRMLLDRN